MAVQESDDKGTWHKAHIGACAYSIRIQPKADCDDAERRIREQRLNIHYISQ